jgi:ribA/ribD-fused uncharacterized protein
MLVDDIDSRDALARYIETTGWPVFHYFWGHTAKDDAIGKHVLSQWLVAPFDVAGTNYLTAEHYMMAEKARLFGDENRRTRILSAATPAEAKKIGRTVKGFNDALWGARRFDIVRRGNLAKFSQHASLRNWLIAQEDGVFVEASPVDAIWGVGLAADDADIHDPGSWRGLNLLGFALVAVRRILKAEDKIVSEPTQALNALAARVHQLQSLNSERADAAIATVTRLVEEPICHLSPCSEFVAALRYVADRYAAEAYYMGGKVERDRALTYAQHFHTLIAQAIQRGCNPN